LYDEMEFLVRFLKEENHIIGQQPSQLDFTTGMKQVGRPHLRTWAEQSCWTKAPMFW
jgi:hypothetical protein